MPSGPAAPFGWSTSCTPATRLIRESGVWWRRNAIGASMSTWSPWRSRVNPTRKFSEALWCNGSHSRRFEVVELATPSSTPSFSWRPRCSCCASAFTIMWTWFMCTRSLTFSSLRQRERSSSVRRWCSTATSKITVVMNSPRVIPTRQIDVSVLRTNLGLNGQSAIVYVGGLNEERDLGVLVRAVAGLRTDPPLRLVMFGYGSNEYRSYLRELAEREGLLDFFLGVRLPSEEVQPYLSLSDIGVVTYQRNPLTELAIPNKVFEYSAVGKPLILARLSALESLFGDAALYYEPGDPMDLREKIRFLLEHPSDARRLAERGSTVLAGCRWDIMEERLRTVYAGLL